ncbi:M23 family metallopeptidase [Chromobacterium amazonense]|uniref:M23 family metallopeptidase n=1 Tax=Chromobacterium amazonense TaxID=1382803 RepID=UPI00237E33B2|nr:M23 family metallopeptidase [Chromobacterium amazonense]MDE1715333.1 M23 family metallopeptidase [Chromobacterium amazonense]
MRNPLALILALAISSSAGAETCMISPTAKEQVSGRFGKFREGGAANFGSGNSKPHMHDGLDFSTSKQTSPIVATTAGTVTWAKLRGSAGNTVVIKRDNGQSAVFYHLSYIAVKEGDKVQAGQEIGRAGATGMKPGGDIHLHFIYGVPNPDDARAKMFLSDAGKNPAFNPAQLPNAIAKKNSAFNYATDPSPYFCKTFSIVDGNPDLYPILGKDTMAQYNKMFGATPPMGVPPSTQFDPVQIAAANSDALQAASKGAPSIASALSDADGYGSLPSAPIGDYETMSPAEMMNTEAMRRFTDSEWNRSITQVSSRALWVDYLRAMGVSAQLNAAIRQKKERMEALMALYTSQKLAVKRQQVDAARERAQRADVQRSIQ